MKKINVKIIGMFILVGVLSLIIPQMNKSEFTVQAATLKKVTKLKKAKAVDGTYFYSKKKQYDGFYRKISWKKVKNAKGYQVFRYNYFSKKRGEDSGNKEELFQNHRYV